MQQQTGFSLVELLIAMVLGLILSAGAVQIFVNNGSVYRVENELSRIQQNGRFIVNSMVEDLRMAGYNGCSSRNLVPTRSAADAPFPFAEGTTPNLNIFNGTESIRGFEAAAGIDANLNIVGATPGSDVLNVQRVATCGAQLTNTFAASDGLEVAANTCGFDDNQAVMVTDCRTADIFQISNVAAGVGTETLDHTPDLASGLTYSTDASIYRYISNAYFIGVAPSGEPALLRSSWTPNADNNIDGTDFNAAVLAEGIEDMQIQYGEDTAGTDGYADVYRDANNVADWSAVRSVRVSLLLRSPDNITSAPRGIMFNGAMVNDPNVAGADRRLRTVYTTTASLRNRLP